ncbi:MAG: hypothetical protein ACLQLO_29165 [Mycobacterium sp.]
MSDTQSSSDGGPALSEEDFSQSRVGQAVRSFMEYMNGLVGFTNQVRISSSLLYGGIHLLQRLVKQEPVDSARHDPLFHALIIIGAWGALEAYVADVCKAVMQDDPTVLENDDIQKLKVSVAEILADHADRPDRVYREMEARFANAQGVDHFENMLKYFDLDASVPKDIKDAVFLAQQIRHVWAHHAGRSDTKFLKYASHLGFQLNEKVAINVEDTTKYLVGIFMYGVILANRWREKNGFDPLTLEDIPATTPLRDAFGSVYPAPPPSA